MSGETTGFLYPFIESEERDATAVLADLATSARTKLTVSQQLCDATLRRSAEAIRAAGTAMADRFRSGGRLYAFGNGGSATDAEGMVGLFQQPPSGRPLPAISLVDDCAVLTALANDVGFELVFSRQIIAHGREGDIAAGFSTSGDSLNVLRAFDEAARRGLLTVGFSGYEGGAMAGRQSVQHNLVVHSDSVHRIQEAQDAVMLALWEIVQGALV
jgi:D-sedoheptulose 7-phosphate isomerase